MKGIMVAVAVIIALAIGVYVFMGGQPANAGGPVIIEDTVDAPVAVGSGLTPGEKIALVAGLLIIGALIADGGGGGGGGVIDPECVAPEDVGGC